MTKNSNLLTRIKRKIHSDVSNPNDAINRAVRSIIGYRSPKVNFAFFGSILLGASYFGGRSNTSIHVQHPYVESMIVDTNIEPRDSSRYDFANEVKRNPDSSREYTVGYR